MKRVEIKNKHNETLVGILHENGNKELVIVCHGSRGSKDSIVLESICKSLEGRFSCFRFDFSGNGESDGKLEESTYSKDLEDLEAVRNYFKDQGFKIKCIIGYSKSASGIVILSKEETEIEQLIALSPRILLENSEEYRIYKDREEEFIQNDFIEFTSGSGVKQKITKEYIEDIKKYWNLNEYSSKIKTPLQIIHGKADTLIDISESEEFAKGKSIRVIGIENADHIFSDQTTIPEVCEKINELLGTSQD